MDVKEKADADSDDAIAALFGFGTKKPVVSHAAPQDEGLSVEDCFPHPESDGKCPVCSLGWPEHRSVDYFVRQEHQAKAHKLYDAHLQVICEIEALVVKGDRSMSQAAYQEKDRTLAVLDLLVKGGSKLAGAGWVIMNYQTGAPRLLKQVWDGSRKPNYGWHRIYNFEAKLLRVTLAQLEMHYTTAEALKKLREQYESVAKGRLEELRSMLEVTESAIRGEQKKFDVLSANSLEDRLGLYMAQAAEARARETATAPIQAPAQKTAS